MFSLLLLILIVSSVRGNGPTPIVLSHGIFDSYDSFPNLSRFLQQRIPGVYVKSLKIGSSAVSDLRNSMFMDVNKQVKKACDMIKDDPKLKKGFHGLGFSQGGQFLRAVVQRCSDPPMFNLITLGSQHEGYFGLKAFLWKLILNSIVVKQNWHNPFDHDKYIKENTFIADINNEKEFNEDYKTNLSKLKNLVLVMFEDDNVVVPRESSWFEFYTKGQKKEVTKLIDSELFINDKIGLKTLFDGGRLHRLMCPGRHLAGMSIEWLLENIVPYLTQTFW